MKSKEIKAKKIVPGHVYGVTQMKFNDKYLSQLLSTIELIRRGDVNGAALSNAQFGWQSSGLPMNGVFIPFLQSIDEQCFKFCKSIKKLKFSKIIIDNFWANINYENDINWPHRHQGDLSGVFYVQTQSNSGDLVLENFNFDVNNKLSLHLNTEATVSVQPKKNKLVLFDANLTHYVTKNLSKNPRISISFNARVCE